MYQVGKILKPQGIKGEVKVSVITSFPDHFKTLKEVFFEINSLKAITIESARLNTSFAILKFKDVHDRNEAEKLRGINLYIPEDQLHPLADDEFYHHQLLGLEVFSNEDEFIGKIIDVEATKANDIAIIKTEAGVTHIIPLVKEIVTQIDMNAKRVTINLIEGLLV